MITKKDAEKIAEVLGTADSGCTVCVAKLCDDMSEQGLGWEFSVREVDGEEVYTDIDRDAIAVDVQEKTPS